MVTTEPILTSHHPVAQCVDLRKTFGDRYRYEWDPAYEVERPEYRRIEAPWLTRIPCRHGRIFPWGDRQLAAYCAAGAVERRQLEDLACVDVEQAGGGEVVVVFDVAHIDAVAEVLKPKMRRKCSPETRAALAVHLDRVRPARKGRLSTVRKDLLGEQETSTQVGLGVTPSDTSVGQN